MKTTVDDHIPVTINRGELGKILDCLCRVWRKDATNEEISNTVLWIRQRLAGLNLDEQEKYEKS